MPNRKITEFPEIIPGDIVDADVLNLVHVFEVDPSLRNKKITFSGFREYLDNYYINVAEIDPFEVNNLIVSGYLSVSGQTALATGLTVSGDGIFKQDVIITNDLNIGNNLSITGNITGNQIDVNNLLGDYLEVISGNFTIATGTVVDFTSGYFDNLSGTTVTGDSFGAASGTVVDLTVTRGIDAVSGYFDYLDVADLIATGVVIISGDFTVNDLTATGTISGATITGDIARFTTVIAETGIFTSTGTLSGATITGDVLRYTTGTGYSLTVTTGNFTDLVASGAHIDTVTGITLQYQSVYISNDLTVTGDILVTGDVKATNITGTFISGVSGEFQNLSGNSVTGEVFDVTTINVNTLNAANLSFSGDQIISGSFTVLENLFVSGSGFIQGDFSVTGTLSGTTITGTSGEFSTLITAPTISGNDGYFTSLYITSGATIGTDTLISGDLTVEGNTFLSGDTSLSGSLNLTSGNIVGDGSSNISGIDYLVFNSGLVNNDLVVSGNLDVSGTATFDELNILSGLVVSGDLFVSGVLTVDDNAFISGNITAVTGIFDTTTGTTSNYTSGNYQVGYVADLYGTNASFTNITGSTVTGDISSFTSGNVQVGRIIDISGTSLTYLTLTGTTFTGTTANFTSGNYQVGNITNLYGTNATFTTITGSTVIGVTADFSSGVFDQSTIHVISGDVLSYTSITGTTITGTTINSATGVFDTLQVNTDLTIDSDLFVASGVYVGTDLTVTGHTTAQSGITVSSGQAVFPSGSASAPSITFDGDLDTGFYTESGGQVNTAINGNKGITIESGTNGYVLTIWAV